MDLRELAAAFHILIVYGFKIVFHTTQIPRSRAFSALWEARFQDTSFRLPIAKLVAADYDEHESVP